MDPHKPLRDDVRLLGELLGETLREQEGTALFDTVERVRALSKAAGQGDESAFRRLADELGAMPTDAALPVARAFTHFLNLANIAEQHHRIRRRRAYQREGAPPQRGSADEAFARLLANGVSPDALHDAVSRLAIRPFFMRTTVRNSIASRRPRQRSVSAPHASTKDGSEARERPPAPSLAP